MSTPTVRKLADDPALGLRLLAGAGAADRTIEGAHTSDLDHPARYLLPGELVLTNGLWTENVDGDRWAAEVNTAGAAAVGFGLADHHPAVPDDLRAACETLGLPLLEVPRGPKTVRAPAGRSARRWLKVPENLRSSLTPRPTEVAATRPGCACSSRA